MRVYIGDCEKCQTKKIEVVAIFRSAFIPDAKPKSPHEITEVCEICLSASLMANEH